MGQSVACPPIEEGSTIAQVGTRCDRKADTVREREARSKRFAMGDEIEGGVT